MCGGEAQRGGYLTEEEQRGSTKELVWLLSQCWEQNL